MTNRGRLDLDFGQPKRDLMALLGTEFRHGVTSMGLKAKSRVNRANTLQQEACLPKCQGH
jgi:hypothetical protein